MWAHYEERKRKTFPISVWHPHTLTHKTREMILPLKNIFLLRLRARKIKRSSNGILYVPEHTLMYHRMRSHPRGCESIPLPDRERETHLGHNRHAIYADIAFFRVMDGYIYGDAVKWTVISHPHKDKTNILNLCDFNDMRTRLKVEREVPADSKSNQQNFHGSHRK